MKKATAPTPAAEGLIVLGQEGDSYFEVLQDYSIPDDEEFAAAGDFSKLVAGSLKLLKAEYDKAVKPLKEEIAKRDALFKPPMKKLMESQVRLKEMIGGYMLEKRQQQAQLAAAAVAASVTATGDSSAKALMTAARQAAAPALKGVSGAVKWKVRIVDADVVPDAFKVWVIDERALQAAVDAGAREIEGCEVYEDVSVRVMSGVRAVGGGR